MMMKILIIIQLDLLLRHGPRTLRNIPTHKCGLLHQRIRGGNEANLPQDVRIQKRRHDVYLHISLGAKRGRN